MSAVSRWRNEKTRFIEKFFLTLLFGVPVYIVSLPIFLLVNTVRCSTPVLFACGVCHASLYGLAPSFYYNAMWWTGAVSPLGVIALIGVLDDANKQK